MKKEEMRFSIRFNHADPRHRNAARMLNQLGRSKAIIVADALWEYGLKHGTLADISGNNDVTAIISHVPNSQRPPIQNITLEQSNTDKVEDGLQDAILAGLSQFRNGDF